MKFSLLTCSCFLFIISSGQLSLLKGTWITPGLELIRIADTGENKNVNYLANDCFSESAFQLFIYGDTLSFQSRYTSSRSNFEEKYMNRYDLRLLKCTDTVLVVKPVSALAMKFFENKPELVFMRQELSVDSSIKPEKIIFHTTGCFGNCAGYDLEVNENRQARLFIEAAYRSPRTNGRDNSTSGYYSGKLSDTLYRRLVQALQTCYLNNLRVQEVLCCDGSVVTIIVYYNGQRKYLKSMTYPVITENLIHVLYEICRINGFSRTSERFQLEE